MPDYFTDITAQETLKCTPEEADGLIKALIGDQKPEAIGGGQGLRALHSDSLFSIEYDRKGAEIYIFGEDHADPDQLPGVFLKVLGALLGQQGREHLEFGYANTCSKHCPDSHGGGRFRIDTRGRIIEPKIVWPRPGKPRRKP
jgi:hypothetical protein